MSRPVTTAIQTWSSPAPAAANNTGIHAAISTAAVITTAITNPDVPRVARINGAGSGHNAAGNVVINGTNILDAVIADTITLNGNTAVDGVKAFKTITSIDTTGITGNDANNTVTVGLGAALGLDNYCGADSFGTKSSITSFTYDAALISKNVVTLSQSLDGSTAQYVAYHPATFVANGGARA